MKKKKLIVIEAVIVVILMICISTMQMTAIKKEGTTIQEGTLTYSGSHYLAGEPLMPGFDPYGYNYQAHMFGGSYANVYLGRYGYPPWDGDDDAYYQRCVDEGLFDTVEEAESSLPSVYGWIWRNVQLVMKWNDAWLSNMDCTGDGALDRHYGHTSYIGSGAWETNHMWESYEVDGVTYTWDSFTKIVAVPDDAELVGDIWYSADGIEIGLEIWGQFAIIQDVYNDEYTGDEGNTYKGLAPVGFGYFQP